MKLFTEDDCFMIPDEPPAYEPPSNLRMLVAGLLMSGISILVVVGAVAILKSF